MNRIFLVIMLMLAIVLVTAGNGNQQSTSNTNPYITQTSNIPSGICDVCIINECNRLIYFSNGIVYVEDCEEKKWRKKERITYKEFEETCHSVLEKMYCNCDFVEDFCPEDCICSCDCKDKLNQLVKDNLKRIQC